MQSSRRLRLGSKLRIVGGLPFVCPPKAAGFLPDPAALRFVNRGSGSQASADSLILPILAVPFGGQVTMARSQSDNFRGTSAGANLSHSKPTPRRTDEILGIFRA
jgi:hypothetical protein